MLHHKNERIKKYGEILKEYEQAKPIGYIFELNLFKQATSEYFFTQELYKVLIETVSYLLIMSNHVTVNEQGVISGRNRNEAILLGLLNRVCRISKGFFSEIVNQRIDTCFILGRSISESAVNLVYLIKKNDPKLFDDFVTYSLKYEKDLLIKIEKNIKDRGETLPIENRMISSINLTFKKSLINPSTIALNKRKPWGDSIYNRFKESGLADLYPAIFSNMSNSVHGNWQDLLLNDLKYDNGSYFLKDHSQRVRPQPLFAISILLQHTGIIYAQDQLSECNEKEDIIKRLVELYNISERIDGLHEEFLNR